MSVNDLATSIVVGQLDEEGLLALRHLLAGHSPILCEVCQVSHCDICGQPCQLAELEDGECEDCRAIG